MPNWCFNNLEISGPVSDLAKLKAQVKGEKSELDFNKIIPYPKEWAEADAANAKDSKIPDGYNHGGYMWCINNWGTKWNVDAEVQGEPEDETLWYGFDSAWSPPEPIIKKLGELFPTLKFVLKYSEPGECYEGKLIVEGGKVVFDECKDMPIYKCKKCGTTQAIGEDEDGGQCWECGEWDWEEVKEEDKNVNG